MLYRVLIGKEDKLRYLKNSDFQIKRIVKKINLVSCLRPRRSSQYLILLRNFQKKIQYFNYDKYTFIIDLRKEFLQ